MAMGKLHPKIESIIEKMRYSDKMISRAGNCENIESIPKKIGALSCTRATKTDLVDRIDDNVLLPNGDVALCCMDFGLQNIIGNLLEMDYESLYHTENYKKVDKKLKSNDEYIMCRFCEQSMPKEEIIDRQNLKSDIQKKQDVNANKIVEIYQEKLKRYPDRAGFEYFYSKITNNEMSFSDLEKIIIGSEEYISSHTPFIKLKTD